MSISQGCLSMFRKLTEVVLSALLFTFIAVSANAGHMFTQASSNTPTWIQSGQGITIKQYGDEGGGGSGRIDIYFEVPTTVPTGADTSNNDWWMWSAGDVMKINLPLSSGTYTYTIAHDAASGTCAYDYCGVAGNSSTYEQGFTSAPTASDLASGVTLPTHSGEKSSYTSSDTYFAWSITSLAGEFSLGGYRIYTGGGTIDGTGAGPLTQDSVVSAEEAESGAGSSGPRPINASDDVDSNVGSTLSTVFDGGTLGVSSDTSTGFTITDNGGAVSVGASNTHTMSGVIGDETGNTGAFEKVGDGTLVLSGTNTYSGGTTVTAGTLQVSSDANLGGSAGDVTLNGGKLAVTAEMTSARDVTVGASNGEIEVASATTTTLSGTVGGAGSLTKSGAGTLVLSGTNTHATTTVSAGTLSVSSDANLGSGNITVNGGTLATTADMTSARTVNVGTSNGVIDVATSTTTTLSGALAGTGDLSKTGDGLLNLTGTSTQSGDFDVDNGSLKVNGILASATLTMASGTNLSGAGTINGDVNANGTTSAGNSPGTLTVAGDFTMTSTSVLDIEVDGLTYSETGGAGSYDRVEVTGAGNVFTADGDLAPVLRGISGDANNDFDPVYGDTFRIVTTEDAAGVTGAFATVTNPTDGMPTNARFDVLYYGDAIDLVLTPDSFQTFAEGYGIQNMIAFGEALDTLRPAAGTNGSTDLDDMVNGFYGLNAGETTTAMLQMSGQIHAFALSEARTASNDAAQQMVAYARHDRGGEDLWFDMSGYQLNYDEDGFATASTAEDRSLRVGLDIYSTDLLTFGVSFGTSDGSVDGGDYGTATRQSQTYGVYAFGSTGGVFYDLAVTGANASFSGSRTTDLSTGSVTNTFDGAAELMNASVKLGANAELSEQVGATLWFMGNFNRTQSAAYDEAGSSVTALSLGQETSESGSASVALEVYGTLGDDARWSLSAGARGKLETGEPEVTREASIHGATWDVTETHPARMMNFADVGLDINMGETSVLSLSAGVTQAQGFMAQQAGIHFSTNF